MPEYLSDEPKNELISGEGWLAAIALSVFVFISILSVGLQVLPDDDNIVSLVWAGGLLIASKILVFFFPVELSFRRPSLWAVIIAVLAASGIHAILWMLPLAEGYLNHYYPYKLIGRIIYIAILCVVFPVVEEIYFRGLLYPIISLKFGVKIGAILSVILFISYHMTSHGLLSLALLGGVSTSLVIRYKTIIPSIAMHITYNSIWLMHGIFAAQK